MSALWATVYTDASWYQQQHRGGWGVWMKCNLGTSEACGPIDGAVARTSQHAEMIACQRGVRLAIKTWPEIAGIHVVTDCQSAIRVLRYGARAVANKRSQTIRKTLYTALGGRKLKMRWVKGHNGGHEPRSWVNERCDALAAQGYARS